MRILELGVDHGHDVAQYESSGARFAPGPSFAGESVVGVMHMAPGGGVGRHPAPTYQLFCVTAGSGWVAGDNGDRVRIVAGQAALWEPGEEHESGTDEGMVAFVIEAAALRVSGSG